MKKILVITGAGASKSLTASMPEKDKISYFQFGEFRELPIGIELISAIISYQDKSISYLLAYFCYYYNNINIKCENNLEIDNQFLEFARMVENIIIEYIKCCTNNEYDKSTLIKKIFEGKSYTKKYMSKRFSINNVSYNACYTHPLKNSKFLSELIDKLDNITNINFYETFSDEIFLWFIDKISSKHSMELLFVNKSYLVLDQLLKIMYENVKIITRNLSYLLSNSPHLGFNSSRRYLTNEISGNSIYKTRKQVYEERIKSIEEDVFKYQPKTNIIILLKDFVEELDIFYKKSLVIAGYY